MIKRISLFALLAAAFGVASCTGEYSWVKNGIDTAVYQLEYMDGAIAGQGKLPRGIIMDFDDGFIASQMGVPVDSMKLKHPDPDKVGQINLTKITGWTSGFYPGSLWIAGDITGDHALWEKASEYTNLLGRNCVRKRTKNLFDLAVRLKDALGLGILESGGIFAVVENKKVSAFVQNLKKEYENYYGTAPDFYITSTENSGIYGTVKKTDL